MIGLNPQKTINIVVLGITQSRKKCSAGWEGVGTFMTSPLKPKAHPCPKRATSVPFAEASAASDPESRRVGFI